MNQGQNKEGKMSDGTYPKPGNRRGFDVKKGGKTHSFEADGAGGDLTEETDPAEILKVITESKPILVVYSSSPL